MVEISFAGNISELINVNYCAKNLKIPSKR